YTVNAVAPPTPGLTTVASALYNRYQITCTNAFGRRPIFPLGNSPMVANATVVPGIANVPPWRGQGQPGGRFGAALAGGDFDGDGASDLFVSEPGDGNGSPPPA